MKDVLNPHGLSRERVVTLVSRCRETRKGLFHKPFREFFSSGACLTSELVRNANPCSLTSIS
jgi:hypothetical protein